MSDGSLTIVTTIDGVETRFSSKAEMEIAPLSAILRYKETNAIVTITLSGDGVCVERQGDYSMYLPLRENEYTDGTLAIAGNEGRLRAYTQRLAYSITKRSVLLQLYYTLIFGEEKQEMRLRINASLTSLEEK